MMYHPDRLSRIRSHLDALMEQDNFEEMWRYSHILGVLRMDMEGPGGVESVDPDFASEMGWDEDTPGYHYFFDLEPEQDPWEEEVPAGQTFLSAVKRKVYGPMEMDFPVWQLEDLEEVEMAEYEIESLEGVEWCRFVRVLDLSSNNLTDIGDLGDLGYLQRLYLADNHIQFIDSLSRLYRLMVLDISHNDVDDLSPLFELEELSYLNVEGDRKSTRLNSSHYS